MLSISRGVQSTDQRDPVPEVGRGPRPEAVLRWSTATATLMLIPEAFATYVDSSSTDKPYPPPLASIHGIEIQSSTWPWGLGNYLPTSHPGEDPRASARLGLGPDCQMPMPRCRITPSVHPAVLRHPTLIAPVRGISPILTPQVIVQSAPTSASRLRGQRDAGMICHGMLLVHCPASAIAISKPRRKHRDTNKTICPSIVA